jgi:hypothetical protein
LPHDVENAASPARTQMSADRDIGSMEQPPVSGCSNVSDEQLPTGPALRGVVLRRVENAASPPHLYRSPRRGIRFILNIPEEPRGFPCEAMVSLSDNPTAAAESPFDTLSETAGQAAGLVEAAEGHSPHHSDSVEHFMKQVLDFPEDNTYIF